MESDEHNIIEMDVQLPNVPTSPTGPSRDLKMAKKAHKKGDIEASIAAHQMASEAAANSVNGAGGDGGDGGDEESDRGLRPHTAAAEKHNKYVATHGIICGHLFNNACVCLVRQGSS